MSYIGNTDSDRREMMEVMGIEAFEELLAPIPLSIRLNRPLALPDALDEYNLVRHLHTLASQNDNLESNLCFLGAGIYDHFRPAVVAALQSRGEFLTAYTPYQPEVSQGVLQAIYEYQSLICALTDMDISNASMYDAATGLAEAALMATSLTGRNTIAVCRTVNPHYRDVIATYARSTGFTLLEIDFEGLVTDSEAIKSAITGDVACVIIQHPNFFGSLEDVESFARIAREAGALSIVAVDPIALGVLVPPGQYGVDIVVGEGQSLGSPMGFGGPLLGFFACKKQFARSFPGRVVGATVDQQGRRGYTMTLRTREQDIRREKATSNICTNQALIALAATIYLCELGKAGMRQVADLCIQKAHYARQLVGTIPGITLHKHQGRFFKEFVVELPSSVEDVNRQLLAHGIVGGLPLEKYYPTMKNMMLLCVTETRSRHDIDRLADAFRAILEK